MSQGAGEPRVPLRMGCCWGPLCHAGQAAAVKTRRPQRRRTVQHIPDHVDVARHSPAHAARQSHDGALAVADGCGQAGWESGGVSCRLGPVMPPGQTAAEHGCFSWTMVPPPKLTSQRLHPAAPAAGAAHPPEMRCSVPSTPARLSPPKSPSAASACARSSLVIWQEGEEGGGAG